MAVNIHESPIELTVADKNFIQLIDNRITAYGQIPYTIPTKLIINVIQDSARFFYNYSWKFGRRCFYRVTIADIMEFTKNYDSSIGGEVGYYVQLPSYIHVIRDIYETDKPASQVPKDQVEYSRSPFGNERGINIDMYRLEAVCKTTEEAAVNTIGTASVPFNFSRMDGTLRIGKKLEKNIILDTQSAVPLQTMYNDGYFIRHVLGCCKRELKRIIGGHTKPLPGGVTLNVEELCNNLEDIEAVETLIKATSSMGDVILSND